MTRSERPIIVVGCPRSGTTLLQLMLHAHPRIAIPPENRFLMAAYDERHRFGDLAAAENRRALARWIVERKKTRFADLGLDGDQVIEQIVAGPPTLGSALGIVLRAYAARFGKPRWGDKRPGYFQRIPVLLRLFPEAQIVHLIRDGRDCVASLKEMDWYKHDIYHAIATWAEAIDADEHAARSLPPGSYHRVYYERLIRDPAMCDPAPVAAVALPPRKTWHARARGAVSTARSGTWRERLAPPEIALCEAAVGERLRRHGYELGPAARPPVGDYARYLRVAAHRRLAAYKRDVVDMLRSRDEPCAVSARFGASAR